MDSIPRQYSQYYLLLSFTFSVSLFLPPSPTSLSLSLSPSLTHTHTLSPSGVAILMAQNSPPTDVSVHDYFRKLYPCIIQDIRVSIHVIYITHNCTCTHIAHAFTICLYTCTVHVDVMSNNICVSLCTLCTCLCVCVCVCVCTFMCVCVNKYAQDTCSVPTSIALDRCRVIQ